MPSAARPYLFNDRTVDSYRDCLTEGIGRVADRIARVRGPFTGIAPDRLATEIARIDLDRPLRDPRAALDELEEVYLRDAVYFHHPRYLAHLNCPVVIPALLGEAILTAVNSSLDTWDQSAGATLIERRLIEWTAARLGLGPAADGVFTSGGTQSNLQALLLAREEARAAEPGRLRVLASEAAHFSVQKSAKLLGLDPGAVVAVPADRDRRMRPDALAWEIERCWREDEVVMAVVATAGTTDFGSIDPLPEIADVCAVTGAWLHVDAAYGCGLLVSPTRRHLLDGIERADSVTVDFHKSFFQPVSSSAVIVRDGACLRHATYHADYLNPATARVPNQVDKSLQTTRRFDALKLWLTLRVMGAEAIGELFDEVVDLAGRVWELLAGDPRFEVAARSQLSTVVFRWLPADPDLADPDLTDPDLIDRANRHARQALGASGRAMVAGTKVDGRQYLKFTILNPETTLEDVAEVLDLIDRFATEFVGDAVGGTVVRV
ncbi:pyridoxal phosphate-dependent decarboxylase family protein [Thermoactinospora rubra]|uniref:pyridoxal phosphate-dependent decarboxylase family protein n=1 Tax=Thermoactinospora rubra TaxID=1088767 RepID=UPI000A111E2C|nr:aspartate aminotransferase family protein [Thermoactinospora rubra]